MPERVKNKPVLAWGTALYLNAWFELTIERTPPERITRSQCFAYARDYEFSERQRDELWHHIRWMDGEYLEWLKKKQPKAPPNGQKPKPSG